MKVGFERRLLAMCRWHVATAVAFPQKRNPTFSAKIKPSVRAAFSFEGGIRKTALGNMPVARCNRRGFSAEKESHLLRQNQAVRQGGFFI
ncbi:hypothetical protein [Agathobaculum sp.]|uniref:hypothetical protein n=1 Tax=Agathobaculum sp. TaxID=2048138 RepID=UPI003FD85D12